MRASLAAWTSILIVFFVVSAAAETPAEDDGPVRLYTNADLAKFGPPPAPPEPVPDSEARAKSRQEDWDLVQRFLDREYARIDSERALAHENRLLERAGDPGAERDVWSYPGIWPDYYAGYGPFGPRGRHNPGYRVLPNSLGSRIVQGGHGRYSWKKGEDAFPGAARPPAARPQEPHRRGPR